MARIDASTRPRRGDGVLDALVDGEVVLLGSGDSRYHGLDPIGSRVWALLDGERSIAEICETLVAEFDVDADRCRDEVTTFVDDLVDNGLVVVG